MSFWVFTKYRSFLTKDQTSDNSIPTKITKIIILMCTNNTYQKWSIYASSHILQHVIVRKSSCSWMDTLDILVPGSIFFLVVAHWNSSKWNVIQQIKKCGVIEGFITFFQVVDLLNPNSYRPLLVRWSKNRGFYVENLFTIQCESIDDLMAVLDEG